MVEEIKWSVEAVREWAKDLFASRDEAQRKVEKRVDALDRDVRQSITRREHDALVERVTQLESRTASARLYGSIILAGVGVTLAAVLAHVLGGS